MAISEPNVKDTPLSLSPQPWMSLSGSDQRRSQRSPVSGTSVGRAMDLIWSKSCRSGERPEGRGREGRGGEGRGGEGRGDTKCDKLSHRYG